MTGLMRRIWLRSRASLQAPSWSKGETTLALCVDYGRSYHVYQTVLLEAERRRTHGKARYAVTETGSGWRNKAGIDRRFDEGRSDDEDSDLTSERGSWPVYTEKGTAND